MMAYQSQKTLHHAVIKDNHTRSNVKVPYNDFSKLKNPSLNDCFKKMERRTNLILPFSRSYMTFNLAL